MKSILKTIICCGLGLAIVQGASAAGETAASSPATTNDTRAATTPGGAVVIDREQVKARLEDRGVQARKKSDLAKQKDVERRNSTLPAGN